MDAVEGRGAPERRPEGKWTARAAAERYARARFRSARRAARDPALVRAALERWLGARPAFLLDAPSGAGRLHAALAPLARRTVGLDRSAAMLAETSSDAFLVRGDVARLPFASRAFGAVVCCRLLHHERDPEGFRRLVAELVRVSDELVVCSFWDAAALPERVRLRPRRDARVARSRRFVREAFAAAGARVLGFRADLRFLARQTFAVARREDA